jgi:Fur family transcriptional regulator, iron response regulator
MADTITNDMPRRPVFEDDDVELPVERLQTQPPAGRRTGCPFHDVRQMLREVGLRPTRQRLALGWLLFAKGDRHMTAESLHEEALRARFPVSLATVYNTLNQFTTVRLLREVAVDGSKTYFDTNNSDHHHFFVEGENNLFDIPGSELLVDRLPKPPVGFEVARVDVVVRLRRKSQQ